MSKFLSSQSQSSSANIEPDELIKSDSSDTESEKQSGSQTTVLSSSLEKMLNVQSTETEMETQSDSEQKIEIENKIEPNEHDPFT